MRSLRDGILSLCSCFIRHRILYSYNRDYLKVYTLDLDKTHMLTIPLVSQKGGDGGIFCCPMP